LSCKRNTPAQGLSFSCLFLLWSVATGREPKNQAVH
jgi:hypothetical protein